MHFSGVWVETGFSTTHSFASVYFFCTFFPPAEGVQDRSHSLSCFRIPHRVVASKTAADPQLWALLGKTLIQKMQLKQHSFFFLLSTFHAQASIFYLLQTQKQTLCKRALLSPSTEKRIFVCQLQLTTALQPLSRQSLAKCALQSFTHQHTLTSGYSHHNYQSVLKATSCRLPLILIK